MATFLLVTNPQFQPAPEGINARRQFIGAFGSSEAEDAAAWIVMFMQRDGEGWLPFTDEEINAFYQDRRSKMGSHIRPVRFNFRTLISDGYIVKQDEHYYVTEAFVYKCRIASPMVSAAVAPATETTAT